MLTPVLRMGLIKSKSPVSGQATWSDDSTQNASLQHRRRQRRRRLPPTPSPWTSGELVDSSPENQAELISALRRKWSEVVGQRSFGQRRSLLRKLLGRLSQKINPHVDTTQRVPARSDPARGRCDADATSSLVSASTDRVHDVNYHYQLARPACIHQHCAPRTTTLSIYRSSLQSCSDEDTRNNNNNNNADKPVETVYQQSNQVCISRYESLVIPARLLRLL